MQLATRSRSKPPTSTQSLRPLLRRPEVVVWCAFVIASPFYVFQSGLPQPGDFIMLLLLPLTLYGWNGRLLGVFARPFRILLWWTAWVVIVQYAWATILNNWGLFGKDTFLLFPIYYVYNALVMLVIMILFQRYREALLRLTMWCLLVSVAIQVLGSFFTFYNELREAVFFNNPNQLGYFSVLVSCMIALLHRKLKFHMVLTAIGLLGALYLTLLSASRAAVAGAALIPLVTLVSSPKIVLAALPLIAALMFTGPVSRAIDKTEHRVKNDQFEEISFLEERGWGRIADHPEYIIVGAGEGGTGRFRDSVIGTHEIHSSAGMIIFSYGIIGTFLFGWFIIRLLRGAQFMAIMMLAPIIGYTVAHHGLRDSMLWMALAIFLAIKYTPPATAGPQKPARAVAIS